MSNIIVFGGDGQIGWPLALALAERHPADTIVIADSFLTRRIARLLGSEPLMPVATMDERMQACARLAGLRNLRFRQIECTDPDDVAAFLQETEPRVVYHLAHQRSAPYSMLGAREAIQTLRNNEGGFLAIAWALRALGGETHLIKLGSMGAYARCGLEIPEGDPRMSLDGVQAAVPAPFPRAADDIYHVSKINDGAYAAMACRKWDLRITDVMQSTVFGAMTAQTARDPRLQTRLPYDEVLGTVVNRFMIQALAGAPLTVYGDGAQVTGLMALEDCVALLAGLAEDPARPGEHRIVNACPEFYSVRALAELVGAEAAKLGLRVRIATDAGNPRAEAGLPFAVSARADYLRARLTPRPVAAEIARNLAFLRSFRDRIDPALLDSFVETA